MAQDKFFIVMGKVSAEREIPNRFTCEDFVYQISNFVFTSIVAEINFSIAVKMAGHNFVNTISDAPRETKHIFNTLDNLIKVFNNQTQLDFLNDMVKFNKLTMHGFKMEDGATQKLLMIKDHDNGTTKFIAEFQIKGMFNPSLSVVARRVFEDYNFEPSIDTREILKLSNIGVNIEKVSRHSNMAINFMEIADQVSKADMKKNDKLYDVLSQCFDCIINFNPITKCPENNIGPILVELFN